MAGEYQTLNLKGHDFGLNSTSQTVEGIWDIYGKPILKTNYKIDSVERKERYVDFSVVSTFEYYAR